MATSVVIEKINNNKIEIIGKTYDSACYSGDVGSREKIKGQTFVTEADVEEGMTVRGEGKDTPIRKVEKLEKAEIFVQLLNAESLSDGKSLASTILRDVWTAKGVENKELNEIFVMKGTNCKALSELLDISACMADTATGARAMGKWYPTMNGKRVIIRLIAPVNEKGVITSACITTDEGDEGDED